MPPARTAAVATLLAATLGLTTLLAFEAFDAARSHRVAAESALREYAGFAVAELQRRTRDSVAYGVVFGLLRGAIAANPPGRGRPFPPPSVLADPRSRAAADLREGGGVRFYYLLHLDSGRLETSGDTVSSADARWVAPAVREAVLAQSASGRYLGLVAGGPARAEEGAAYFIKFDAARRPVAVYGAVFPLRKLAPVFARVMAGSPLLPHVAATLANDSVLAVSVAAPGGTEIYRSTAPVSATYAAEERMDRQVGGLRLVVAPRPEAAAQLLIGGLPSSRAPTLIGLLVLAGILVGATVLLLRREAELVRLRSDFVASVSHELRTPLAQIRMFSETLLLDRVRSDAEGRRSLEIVAQESRRLSHLVENLLYFSRSVRGPVAAAPAAEPVEVGPLIRDVAGSFRPLAAARAVAIRVAAGNGLLVRADADALRQMLLNLLDNTLKYGPEGQTVTLGACAAPGGATVCLTVDDEGPGIPPADRRRIFERFARLERRGSGAVAGSGIGLAVVRELAERFGGRAWAEDAPAPPDGPRRGPGARFVVELPAAVPVPVGAPPTARGAGA